MSASVNANGAAGDVAIQHWIRLTSGEATEADRHACAAWRAADPAHERAWARLAQGVAGSVGRLEGVLGADQVLDCTGLVYDKPDDLAAARRQLLALRGRRHELISA
ncbi:MAG: DUF4880 domain-containing protein, partial [Bordetella sp.]|nr:DUF4880 domain-containing protein [Bordetella sp.]